jgi:DUF1016 N-terminal domain
LATTDGDLPLLHHTHARNEPYSVMFHSVVDPLFARCRALSEEVDQITLVFDKGNNSEVNLDLVEQGALHFVGSLVATQHEDLMAIEREQMRRLDRSKLPAVWAYRTEKKVFGRNRTVLTFNQQLFNAQRKTLNLEINKRKRKLEKLQDKLQRTRPEDRGNKPTVDGVEKNVKEILRGRHMKDLFSAQVTKTQQAYPACASSSERTNIRIRGKLIGKRAIISADYKIGRHIVEFEQNGAARAEYGKRLLPALAAALTTDFGKGFDAKNLWHMRRFFLAFPILDAVRRELSWTHYRTLLRVETDQARQWYMNETANRNWTIRALERQLCTLYRQLS